jgi:hypothetical protein
MSPALSKLVPHLIAYFILLLVAFIRFSPAVFEGKSLQQSDNLQALGMQAEMRKVKEQTGDYPLWTNGPFAGMPSYQILYASSNLMQYVAKTFQLGNSMAPPHTSILLMMAGMYLLLIVLGVDWRIAIASGIGFGLAANHLGLLEAGHSTKIIASAYMAPILAGLILTFRGKFWLGSGLTALFTALQLYANHVQITYYFFLSLLVFGIVFLVDAVKNRTLPNFLKAAVFAVIAVAIAVPTNAGRLMTTQEYASETIRGKSELAQKEASSGSDASGEGLSKEYAFQWSYGKLETFNLLIPNFAGGSSSKSFASDPNSATIAALRQMKSAEEATSLAQQTSHYWGAQPFTGGGVYMGIVFVLLFMLGAVLVKSPIRWYIIAFVLLTIPMAWGKNFAGFNYFLFDNFPLYNKFRDPKTVFSVSNMLIVLLGALGLQAFFDKNLDESRRKSALYIAGGITGGLLLLALLLSFTLDYQKEGENFPAAVAAALAKDRAGLLQADALRSMVFAGLGFAALLLAYRKILKPALAVLVVGLFAVLDVWLVGTRFIDSGSYISSSEKQRLIAPSAADEQIQKDPDPYYRVADFRRSSPFSNAFTGFHHKSMGGYHAAKLMRYQEMVERYLNDPQKNQHLYGMLNAKYFIGQNDQVIPNPKALGNAWFVKSYETVSDGDAEIAALANLDPKEKAVIQQKYAAGLQGFNIQFDSAATIRLTRYHPDTLTYQYTAASDQLAVFSEMYYPPSKGWGLYIDGQKTDDFIKANFTLRAAKLPAGQHELKMVFSPNTYHSGETVSLIASTLVLALAGWGIFWFTKHYEFPNAANLPVGETKTAVKKAPKPTEPRKKK